MFKLTTVFVETIWKCMMVKGKIGINNIVKTSMKAEILDAEVELDLARRWKNERDEKARVCAAGCTGQMR